MFMKTHGHEHPFRAMHLPDTFIEHGPRGKLLELSGLSPEYITLAIDSMNQLDMNNLKSAPTGIKIDPRISGGSVS
jgi:deoxyxylulose-5-phosphate synthase